MLALQPPRCSAACWAAAYLQLAPKYSPAGSVSLYAWLRHIGTLGLLLGCAVSAAGRRCAGAFLLWCVCSVCSVCDVHEGGTL